MHLRPNNINAAQWQDACNRAQIYCSEFKRNGGTARDATRYFGLGTGCVSLTGWKRAEELIAERMCDRK